MLRISTPTPVPPGSRVQTTVRPAVCNASAKRAACVDFPEPSPPSSVMKKPGYVTFVSLLCRRLPGGCFGRCPLRTWSRRSFVTLDLQQLNRPGKRHFFDRFGARNRRVRDTIGDVGPEPAILQFDRLAADRVILEFLHTTGCASRSVFGLRKQLQRATQVNLKNCTFGRQRAGVLAALEVGAVPTVLRGDLLAVLGVNTDSAWQAKQLERGVQIDVGGAHSREQRGGAGFDNRTLCCTLGFGLGGDDLPGPQINGCLGRRWLIKQLGHIRPKSTVFHDDSRARYRVKPEHSIFVCGRINEFPRLWFG